MLERRLLGRPLRLRRTMRCELQRPPRRPRTMRLCAPTGMVSTPSTARAMPFVLDSRTVPAPSVGQDGVLAMALLFISARDALARLMAPFTRNLVHGLWLLCPSADPREKGRAKARASTDYLLVRALAATCRWVRMDRRKRRRRHAVWIPVMSCSTGRLGTGTCTASVFLLQLRRLLPCLRLPLALAVGIQTAHLLGL